jgi:hypothetical protein
MSDTITRRECPDHGHAATFVWEGCDACSQCSRQLVERTYVAVDALLSDDAIHEAAIDVFNDITEMDAMRHGIRAAIEAVS